MQQLQTPQAYYAVPPGQKGGIQVRDAADIARCFALAGQPHSCERYGFGHINQTFLLVTDSGRRYILQGINEQVFADIPGMMRNIASVTRHISARVSDPRACLHLVPTLSGEDYYVDAGGKSWRVYDFVENSICLQKPDSPCDFYQSAVAFGRFQQQLSDFPAHTLSEAIPNFHNTPVRYRQLHAALDAADAERIESAAAEIEEYLAREASASALQDMLHRGELPLRVTHNDTKLNNVLLDPQTGCAKCVLDLDTVMPGLSAYDFGDGVRFGASSAAEDEKDLDQVWLKLDMYQAFLEGYLDACGHALTPKEIEVLPLGAKIITAELAMRFLKDYLDGDVYFKIDYPTQNLDRCRTQLKLVADMEAKWPEMQRILRETAAVRCAQPTTPQ